METERALLISGTLLLTLSALCGFIQHRHRARADTVALWRVVHAGGTAGAVQLLALAALWDRLAPPGAFADLLAAGLIVATWAFFLGPLARALGGIRTARAITGIGAALAVPAYLALPWHLL
jgi:hypothetical protein